MASIPSLESLCMNILLLSRKDYNQSMDSCLQYYQFLNDLIHLGLKDMSNLMNHMQDLKRSITLRFPAMIERYDEENLKALLSAEFYQQLQDELQASIAAKKKMASYRSGSIAQVPSYQDIQPSELGFYPLEALVQGVEWPKGIDVAKREYYLEPDEFYRVFRMNKDQFYQLSKIDRIKLKKAHQLF